MAATEKVGILIELEDAEEALRTLKEIDNTVRDLGRKKTMIRLDDGNLTTIDDRIKEIQDKLTALRASKSKTILDHGEVKTAKELNGELQVLKRGLRDATANAKTFKQVFNSWSSKIAHAGSAMQSFGNALTQITSPFRQLTNGIIFGAGYKVLNSFTEGLESGFERADVMRKYPRVMENMGYSATKAQESIDALDRAVQGLPTSLVDMVSMAQRFTSTMGDITDGTNLAIAANNAFLASMSTDTQKYQGMMQLQDVIGGKDMNAREWQALANSMLPAIRMMGEYLGYEGKELDEYVSKVQQGKIANKDFIDTLIKAGTEEGGKIRSVALESLDTWEAFFSRVGTAASKFTYKGILEPLNDIVKTVTGGKFESVNLLLDGLIYNGIDKMGKSVRDWIHAHPEEITEFFKTLKQIDVKSFLKGFAEGLLTVAKGFGTFAKVAGKIGGLGALGKFMALGNFLGRFINAGGGLLKGGRHPLGLFGALGTVLFDKLSKKGIFGKLTSIFGKKSVVEQAGEAAKAVPTVADTFKGAFKSLQGVIQAAGAITIVSGTGFIAFKAVKSMLSDLKEIGNILDDMTFLNAVDATAIITGIGAFTKIFQALGTALGPQGLLAVAIGGAATFIGTSVFAADMWSIKTGVIQIRDTIKELDNIATEITNFQGIGTLGEGVKQKFTDTIAAINEIKGMFVGKSGSKMDRGQVEAGLPTFGIGKVGALTNIANALKQIQSIATQLNTLSATTVNDPSAVLEKIKAACNHLQGIRGPKGIEGHTKAVANAMYQIRRMAYHINKLAGTSVDTGGFAVFVQQIKTALEELKSLSQTLELDIKVVIGAGFQSSVNGVVKKINDGGTRIKNAAKKIPSAITKHVSVTITASVNTRQAVDAITNGANIVKDIANNVTHPAMGGTVYRAHGGNIPFRRRGTDTVPAMLTPGEYVHNKRAVSLFGIDFMRKVNNLDMKGAMAELMHRAGSMANVNRGANITNNYNNNQKVIINNNGNTGAGFTFKTASRFVGAI